MIQISSLSLIDRIEVKGSYCKVVINSEFKSRYLLDDFWYTQEGCDLEALPNYILLIPFILNIAPIVWISGDEFWLDEMDSDLCDALQKMKAALMNMYPNVLWAGELLVKEKLKFEPVSVDNIACALFSGGLDSFSTSFSHLNQKQILVTVRGSDVKLDDDIGWANVKKAVSEYSGTFDSEVCFIESNFTSFLNYRMLNNLTPDIRSWWTLVQHGMGLAGFMAIPGRIHGASTGYIASSHSYEFSDQPWASCPEIDDNIKWSGFKVQHDGFEYTRQGKVGVVVNAVKKESLIRPNLRVCYISSGGKNCSRCEKCLRTMAGLVVAGENYSSYGFDLPVDEFVGSLKAMFSKARSTFHSNTLFHWKDIQKHISLTSAYNNGPIEDFLHWLKVFDFDVYYRRSARIFSRKSMIKRFLKGVPGIYGVYVLIKKYVS